MQLFNIKHSIKIVKCAKKKNVMHKLETKKSTEADSEGIHTYCRVVRSGHSNSYCKYVQDVFQYEGKN